MLILIQQTILLIMSNKNASIDYLVDVKEAGTYNVMIKVASGEDWAK